MLQSSQRSKDQEGPSQLVYLVEMVKERKRHDGLSEAHLIGKNDIPVFMPSPYQPVETLDLVFLQLLAWLFEFRNNSIFLAVLPDLIVCITHDLLYLLVEHGPVDLGLL